MRKAIGRIGIIATLAAMPVAATAQMKPPLFEDTAAPDMPGEITLDTPRSDDAPPEGWLRDSGYMQVRNVHQATLLPFLPPAHLATGDAVIVAPGGAFLGLSMQTEGWEVARALADRGIAAFVLKYRLLPTPASIQGLREGVAAIIRGKPTTMVPPPDTPQRALEDATGALRYVRSHAASYRIDPQRIGMMGFSAGGVLTLSAALKLPKQDRPAFIAPIYPRMTAREVPADAPPMFVAIAADDSLMDPALGLITSWHRARRPVELHLFQAGGHGFGLGGAGTPTGGWFDAFIRWREYNRNLPAVTDR